MMFFRYAPQPSWQDQIFERVFKDRKVCEYLLLPFGFVRKGDGFTYQTELLDGRFALRFDLHESGDFEAELHSIDGRGDETLLLPKKPTSLLGKNYERNMRMSCGTWRNAVLNLIHLMVSLLNG